MRFSDALVLRLKPSSAWGLFCAGAFASVVAGLHAQTLRDPTVAPKYASTSPGQNAGENPAERKDLSVLVVNGQARVVLGSRLYAAGEKMGNATVERITETEIWLREAQALHKISLYAGVQRKSDADAASAPECGAQDRIKKARPGAAKQRDKSAVKPQSAASETSQSTQPQCRKDGS